MSETQFTPAPWSVVLDLSNDGDIDVQAADFLAVASIDVRGTPEETGSVPREVAIANARLIAAAPELYAVLEEFLRLFPVNESIPTTKEKFKAELTSLILEARVVVAKARGLQ